MTAGSPVESPVRGNSHAGFGGAGRGNGPSETAEPRPGPTLPYIRSYSSRRQGADPTWTKRYTLHPLLCFVAEFGMCLHAKLRRGRSGS